MLVRLKPYVSPDVVIDCPPSMLFLSIYIRLNSLVLYTSQSNEVNIQTFAVARKENLGAKNDTGKFRVFC